MVFALKRLFGLGEKHSTAAKPASPPVPAGEWSIVVNTDGDPVTGRPPQPGDLLARPAIPYRYNGTIPVFEPSAHLTAAENMRARVDYEIRNAQNRTLIDKAVFLLSQTDDGRRLLQKAQNEKFSFVFDHARLKGEEAVGLCDYSNKLIPLAEGRSPEQVAITIKHELQHMEDISSGLGYGTGHTLKSATIANRALESNARVSEAVFAMEAMLGSPRGPDAQFRTHAIFNWHYSKNPHVGDAASHARPLAEKGDWSGFANAVFPAYYRQDATLAYYDKRNIEMYAKNIPDIKKEKTLTGTHEYYAPYHIEQRMRAAKKSAGTMLTQNNWTTDLLAFALKIKGVPYLKADKNFAPDSGRAIELTPDASEKLDDLKARLDYLGIDKSEGLTVRVREPQPSGLKQIFTEARAKMSPPPFQPIVLPARADGMRLTSGETEHSLATRMFTEIHTGMKSGRGEIDKLNFSICQYVRDVGTGNIASRVGNLVEAGLRAPVGAFPPDYLFDLAGRLRDAGKLRYSDGVSSPIRPWEVSLFQHWQAMAMEGMSPAWINAKYESENFVSTYDDMKPWMKFVLDAIPADPIPREGGTAAGVKPRALNPQ